MDNRTNWSCLVDKQGAILEWEDKAGAEFMAAFPQLLDYAKALLISKRDFLCFFYQAPDGTDWFEVSFLRHQHEFNLVHIKLTELPFELSKRELEILTLVSAGLSNKEISEQLYISERTIAKHIEHLFEKTQIDNRTMLAVFAMSKNLCCLPTPGNLSHSILATYKVEQITKTQQAGSSAPIFANEKPDKHVDLSGFYFIWGYD